MAPRARGSGDSGSLHLGTQRALRIPPIETSRRDVLRALAAACGLAFVPSCHSPRERGEVLGAIVRDVVVPNTVRVAADSRALRSALASFAGNDSPTSLGAARKAFRTALLSWKRLSTFKSGPVVGAFARTYAAAERSSLEQLLARSIDAIDVIVGRITRILRLRAEGTLRPTDVEGYYSKMSLDIALALLAGTEGLYLGSGSGGVTDLVTRIASPADVRVRTHFAAARDALSELGAPLEEAALTKEADLVRAQTALRTLEIAMKTEVTSALGVTVTFSGSDGDWWASLVLPDV